MGLRILLLADSHLGFDLPLRPRVARRRRGHDFLANYAAALEPALAGEVDLVVHGGDVFHMPHVPPSLAWQAFVPLARVADRGVPVFLVPGNHERSRLPHMRFGLHSGVHVFDRPRTFVVEVRGTRISLAGFPYERRDVRTRFPVVLERTGWSREHTAIHLLCVHHCFEGATVGPGDFTFTTASDVIRLRDVPPAFAAVFSGHIHRQQVLTKDLRGTPIASPVLYPGSIERTAFAEMGERKGYMFVDMALRNDSASVRWEFRELPARPMIVEELCTDGMSARSLELAILAIIARTPCDAVLRIKLTGPVSDDGLRVLSAGRLRRLAPASMNVEIQMAGGVPLVRSARRVASRVVQLELERMGFQLGGL